MREGDNSGSRNGGGSAFVIVVALYPEVTCSSLEVKLMCHYCILRMTCRCRSIFSGHALASEKWIQIQVFWKNGHEKLQGIKWRWQRFQQRLFNFGNCSFVLLFFVKNTWCTVLSSVHRTGRVQQFLVHYYVCRPHSIHHSKSFALNTNSFPHFFHNIYQCLSNSLSIKTFTFTSFCHDGILLLF